MKVFHDFYKVFFSEQELLTMMMGLSMLLLAVMLIWTILSWVITTLSNGKIWVITLVLVLAASAYIFFTPFDHVSCVTSGQGTHTQCDTVKTTLYHETIIKKDEKELRGVEFRPIQMEPLPRPN